MPHFPSLCNIPNYMVDQDDKQMESIKSINATSSCFSALTPMCNSRPSSQSNCKMTVKKLNEIRQINSGKSFTSFEHQGKTEQMHHENKIQQRKFCKSPDNKVLENYMIKRNQYQLNPQVMRSHTQQNTREQEYSKHKQIKVDANLKQLALGKYYNEQLQKQKLNIIQSPERRNKEPVLKYNSLITDTMCQLENELIFKVREMQMEAAGYNNKFIQNYQNQELNVISINGGNRKVQNVASIGKTEKYCVYNSQLSCKNVRPVQQELDLI